MKTKKKLPKGYTCMSCGKWHRYHPYVFAHWTTDLVHTCTNCGTKWNIYEGVASMPDAANSKRTTGRRKA